VKPAGNQQPDPPRLKQEGDGTATFDGSAAAVGQWVDGHREKFGVESTYQVLEVAPSTYYEAPSSASPRQLRDAELKVEIECVRKEGRNSN